MLARIVETVPGWLARQPVGYIALPPGFLLYAVNGTQYCDYLADTGGVYPPDAVYVAQQDGTIVVPMPTGFTPQQDYAGWDAASLQAAWAATIPTLTTADIQALTTAQVAALSTTELASLTSDQVAALTTADLKALTTAQVAALV